MGRCGTLAGQSGRGGTMPRACFALDLKDDPRLIAEYERRHAPGNVWTEVLAHLKAQGFHDMQIWRTGDRLVMIAEVSDDYPRPVAPPPRTLQWEEEMSRFQRPLPHAADGQKWVPMDCIFDWRGKPS
jgi:L-rhamnose mutarotase